HLARQFAEMLSSSDLVFECPSSLDACAKAPATESGKHWFSQNEVVIQLAPGTITGTNTGCKSLASEMFHEALHYLLGLHPSTDDKNDPGDRVDGCQYFCFGDVTGKGSSMQCAQCLGTRFGDSRCKRYPQRQTCSASAMAMCGCSSK